MCLIEKIFLKFFSNYKSVRAVDRKGGGGGGGAVCTQAWALLAEFK